MKRYYWLLAAALIAGVIGMAPQAQAQQSGVSAVWANYRDSIGYNYYGTVTLGANGGAAIPTGSFMSNGVGPATDLHAGIAWGIPVGFTDSHGTDVGFEYNGNRYHTIGVGVDGFVILGSQRVVLAANAIAPGNLFTGGPGPYNVIAPFWGNHWLRTPADVQGGSALIASSIRYRTLTIPGKPWHEFRLEWQNLNVNDPTNPSSIATFMLIIDEDTNAYSTLPSYKATFRFEYGPVGFGGNSGTVKTTGASVGCNDSVGFTFINSLYNSLQYYDNVRTSTRLTTCYPPQWDCSLLPGNDIMIVPVGKSAYTQWGDGDCLLRQVSDPDPKVRANQSRFDIIKDADTILASRASERPLDSIEGHAAFHGDANHTGRVYNSTYGAYFYHVESMDAAYILMYLAGKLAILPWPVPLPVPGYKESDPQTTVISGVVADVTLARMTGNTVLVPITVRGHVNGPIGVELNVSGMNAGDIQFVGTRSIEGGLVHSSAVTGKVALAATGQFEDGATIGYLEFQVGSKDGASFDLSNVTANDQAVPASHVALRPSNGSESISSTTLEQNVPNPFVLSVSGTTHIGFGLAASENVSLRIFNMLGHEVRTLVADEMRPMGHNVVMWDGRDAQGLAVPSGLYYYQLVTPSFTQTVKMQVVN